jgi:hypothetical protein
MIDLVLLISAILGAYAVIYWSLRNDRLSAPDQQRGLLRMRPAGTARRSAPSAPEAEPTAARGRRRRR